MCDTNQGERRQDERKPSENPVKFIMEGDVINAVSVDISDGGIRLDTERALEISLRFGEDEKTHEATLVWARRKLDGGVTYGFEYVSGPPK